MIMRLMSHCEVLHRIRRFTAPIGEVIKVTGAEAAILSQEDEEYMASISAKTEIKCTRLLILQAYGKI